jgi:hypothetical protein
VPEFLLPLLAAKIAAAKRVPAGSPSLPRIRIASHHFLAEGCFRSDFPRDRSEAVIGNLPERAVALLDA